MNYKINMGNSFSFHSQMICTFSLANINISSEAHPKAINILLMWSFFSKGKYAAISIDNEGEGEKKFKVVPIFG